MVIEDIVDAVGGRMKDMTAELARIMAVTGVRSLDQMDPTVIHRTILLRTYSFLSSTAGLVLAAFSVCQSTVPKAIASEITTASANTHPYPSAL